MTTFRRMVFACFAAGCCSALAQEAQEAPPSLYSFADLYRMTVNAAAEAPTFAQAAPSPQRRVALAAQDVLAAASPASSSIQPLEPCTGETVKRGSADRAETQLVARVNGVEISARQVRTGGAPSVAQAVERIIERELLVQKALEAGLERDPLVKDSIDNARRQVLAQAYLERAAGARAAPSREEVRAFYNENPALFAERRIYRMRELVVSAPAEMIAVLRAQAARTADLDELAAWLKSRNARFSAATETQPAEQLPLAFLPQLARMKSGEIAVFATPLGASVVQLIHAEDAPLGPEQAQALIEQFLAGRKRLEIAAAEVKRLRESARIEYVAQFKR
jgi:EpsD family peptidyl-prolyl cis-trans isomerase